MDPEIKMTSDLRHTSRNQAGLLAGMFVLIGVFSAAASLTRYTNKPVSYAFAGASFGVVGLGGVKVSQLEKRRRNITRQLKQFREAKQNG